MPYSRMMSSTIYVAPGAKVIPVGRISIVPFPSSRIDLEMGKWGRTTIAGGSCE
jgi:hypothetical protein